MLGVRLVEGLFVLGIAGSIVVVVITSVEDAAILFESDKPIAERGDR